jgi:hypothetical protein
LPETVAVPTVVPLVQVVGAAVCGPKTVKVIVPVAELVAPDSVEETVLLAIIVPVDALAGAVALVAVAFLTVVELIPAPHVLVDARLALSPL